MNLAIDNFKLKIDGIKRHIKYAENLQTVLLLTKNSAEKELKESSDCLRNENTSEKIFNYRSNIISLYGAFEHFVEEITKEYVDELLKNVQHFSQLDETIRKNYFSKWKSLSEKLSWSKYAHLDEQKLIASLHDSIIKDSPSLLFECFLHNGGNYKHSAVSELYASLGLDDLNSKLSKYEPLSTWMIDNDLAGKESCIQYATLDDLVDKRNEIAHGSETTDDILSDDKCLSLIEFISSYASSLYFFLSDSINKLLWLKMDGTEYRPSHLYHENEVAVFEVSNVSIRKGEKLLIMHSEECYPRFSYSEVKEIHHEINGHTEVKDELLIEDENVVISLEMDDKVKVSTSFKFRNNSAKVQ